MWQRFFSENDGNKGSAKEGTCDEERGKERERVRENELGSEEGRKGERARGEREISEEKEEDARTTPEVSKHILPNEHR